MGHPGRLHLIGPIAARVRRSVVPSVLVSGSRPPFAVLLGVAQDAGVPQAGCRCTTCEAARRDPARRELVTCLGLVDPATGSAWLVDATPDFREQLAQLAVLAPGCRLAGILLTHAHVGHYLGLAQLGREAMNARGLPLFATGPMTRFLERNAPWSQLVALGNVVLYQAVPGQPVDLSPSLSVEPVAVPHRAEHSDTVAWQVRGLRRDSEPGRTLFYCPDIDRWDAWDRDLRAVVSAADVAIVDGTFFGPDELPGRDMAEVPHPLVTDTVARLEGRGGGVVFTHLNHTNPLLAAGKERAWIESRGHTVGRAGTVWGLAAAASDAPTGPPPMPPPRASGPGRPR